ncbi:DUF29 domain-containing protein [Aphanizomenon sp. CS-733/32]|uniref:DUF29 domain-containing protein n=1 Tax=Aphanizomenon sp. CS-733/32 TaxID=3021715 RepID=UPI00232CF472|nr:DUF29 domain-containing protein [Aphanizomenon sp. CS-733/32]MDB9309520.1 DUF29 domain-containing protein [Aphanizomenon sp. CS-733/32]
MKQAISVKTTEVVSLYKDDYLLWTEEIVQKLRARDFNQLDIDNLIEEIESLGKETKRAFKGHLRAFFEHLLKRVYVNMPQEFNGWERTIDNVRVEIEDILEDSPSLRPYSAEIFDVAYQQALKKVKREYPQYSFPDTWQFNREIESILNQDFWLD